MKFDQDLCATCDMNSTLGSVVPLAMFDLDTWAYHWKSDTLVIQSNRTAALDSRGWESQARRGCTMFIQSGLAKSTSISVLSLSFPEKHVTSLLWWWCGCWTSKGGLPWFSPSPASSSSYSSFPHLLDFHLEDLRCKDGTTSTSLILFLESWNLSHSILGILKGMYIKAENRTHGLTILYL